MSAKEAHKWEERSSKGKNMLIKSLVLILVNDSILGHKNERAELAVNSKKESAKKKNCYEENSM